jgi:hypothetical protein
MNKQHKQIITEAYTAWFKQQHPNVPNHCIPKPMHTDTSANALTKLVINFLKWNGHQAERISTTGRPIDNTKRVQNALGETRQIGSIEWIPGTGRKGSADISSTIKVDIKGVEVGLAVKWEVKMKDKQSKAQKEYEMEIKQSAGHYYIIHNFEEFYNYYQKIILPIL